MKDNDLTDNGLYNAQRRAEVGWDSYSIHGFTIYSGDLQTKAQANQLQVRLKLQKKNKNIQPPSSNFSYTFPSPINPNNL